MPEKWSRAHLSGGRPPHFESRLIGGPRQGRRHHRKARRLDFHLGQAQGASESRPPGSGSTARRGQKPPNHPTTDLQKKPRNRRPKGRSQVADSSTSATAKADDEEAPVKPTKHPENPQPASREPALIVRNSCFWIFRSIGPIKFVINGFWTFFYDLRSLDRSLGLPTPAQTLASPSDFQLSLVTTQIIPSLPGLAAPSPALPIQCENGDWITPWIEGANPEETLQAPSRSRPPCNSRSGGPGILGISPRAPRSSESRISETQREDRERMPERSQDSACPRLLATWIGKLFTAGPLQKPHQPGRH